MNQPITGFRTIAESIALSGNPHQAAVTAFARQEIIRCQNRHIYYFDDDSFLEFAVSYSVSGSGVKKP
jgi:hypothetical protein